MKNGQLWFNTQTRRVERVTAAGPRVCATSFHREDLMGWPNSYLRRATKEEVKQYLEEVAGSSTTIVDPSVVPKTLQSSGPLATYKDYKENAEAFFSFLNSRP